MPSLRNLIAVMSLARLQMLSIAHLGNFFSIAQLLQAGAVLLMPFILRRTGLISGIMAAQLTAAAVGLLAAGYVA